MYIDGMAEARGNIAGFINSSWPFTTNKKPNFIFEGHEGNCVFTSANKSIVVGEELLVDYNKKRINANISIMGEVYI